MFPEGTRSADGALQSAKPGVGMLSCKAQVPVVPARIFGSFEAYGRDGGLHMGSPVAVSFGKPLSPAEYDLPNDGKERYSNAAARFMEAIDRLDAPQSVVI